MTPTVCPNQNLECRNGSGRRLCEIANLASDTCITGVPVLSSIDATKFKENELRVPRNTTCVYSYRHHPMRVHAVPPTKAPSLAWRGNRLHAATRPAPAQLEGTSSPGSALIVGHTCAGCWLIRIVYRANSLCRARTFGTIANHLQKAIHVHCRYNLAQMATFCLRQMTFIGVCSK